MDRPEGELVSTGSFRVDRAKALEKLSRYQTPDARLFMLPWVRAAVAGRATRIGMGLAKDGNFMMNFDGAPLRPDAADPSACLFEQNPEPRLKLLAVGILAALRLEPEEVTLTSGAGAERRCLTLGCKGTSIETCESDTTDTILWVLFRGERLLDDWPRRVFEACRASPVPIRVGDSDLEPFDAKDAVGELALDGGRRIWLEPAEGAAAINVFQFGVWVCDWKRSARAAIPVAGFIDDPALDLDASHTAVVSNEKRAAAEEALARASQSLVVTLARAQRDRFEGIRDLLRDRDKRFAFKTLLAGKPCLGLARADRRRMEDPVYATRWLAWLSANRNDERLSAHVRRALADAPLDVDASGRPEK